MLTTPPFSLLINGLKRPWKHGQHRVLRTGLPPLLDFFLLLSTLLFPVTGQASEVAILISADRQAYAQAVQSFRSGLDPRHRITTYTLSGKPLADRTLGERIRTESPDLILAVGLRAALIAKLELVDTPVLFCLVLYPEQNGLPAPNMVGITMTVPLTQQFETIQAVVPHGRRIGILHSPHQDEGFLMEARDAIQMAGLSAVLRMVPDETTLPSILRNLLPHIDILWLPRDPSLITLQSTPYLLDTALEFKVPVFTFSPGLVRHGAIASLAPSFQDIGLQASQLANHWLKPHSRKPALRLMAPTQARLALNLQTAEALGLTLPSAMVAQAESIFGGKPGAFVQEDSMRNETSNSEISYPPMKDGPSSEVIN